LLNNQSIELLRKAINGAKLGWGEEGGDEWIKATGVRIIWQGSNKKRLFVKSVRNKRS
jgi:hypothetical protein